LVPTGYDKDRSFLSIEISGDHVYFQAISRTGVTVDSRTIRRPMEFQPISESMDAGPVTAKGLVEKMPVPVTVLWQAAR
jgi:hypothetical protein